MTRLLAILAALAAFSQPALAGSVSDAFWNSYAAGAGAFNDYDPPPQRMSCGQMGLDSSGVCRSGILGAIDQQNHGVCVIDRSTMGTRCQR